MGYHHEPPEGFEFPVGIQADASLREGPSASTEFALQAAARTQSLTNVLINVHTASTYRTGAMACDLLEKAGADLTRVGIHHAGETNDVDYLHGLLDRGASLCMDPHRYEWNLPMIARLVSEGYAEQIVLAVDSVLVEEAPLPAFWISDASEWAERSKEWMPSHVPLAVIPGLKEHGVSDQAIRLMTVENPARLLER
jgi:phosphotriesterase-related protein